MLHDYAFMLFQSDMQGH